MSILVGHESRLLVEEEKRGEVSTADHLFRRAGRQILPPMPQDLSNLYPPALLPIFQKYQCFLKATATILPQGIFHPCFQGKVSPRQTS